MEKSAGDHFSNQSDSEKNNEINKKDIFKNKENYPKKSKIKNFLKCKRVSCHNKF